MDPLEAGHDPSDPRFIPTNASKDLTDIPEWLYALQADQLEDLDLEVRYAGQTRKDHLGDSGIDFAIFERFCQILAFNESLERLSLRRCNINDPGLLLLGKALMFNPTLTELDLRENNLSSVQLQQFAIDMQCNYMLHNCKVEEHAKDLHSKNAKRLGAFTLETVDTLLVGDSEGELFNQAWELLVQIVLIPNRENNLTLGTRLPEHNRGTVLNLGGRRLIPRPLIQTYLRMCKDHLTILSLDNCNIDMLPREIREMTRLTELYITNNNISMLREEIGLCQDLKIISAAGNKLKRLPDSIALLLDLSVLDVRYNEITEVPITLVKLKQLERLCISNNPISKPAIPRKVWEAENGNREGRAVLEYCRQLYASSRIVNRCKLMFVGDGGVGKTSLVTSLKAHTEDNKMTKKVKKSRGGFIATQEPNVATDGIEVNSIIVKPGKKLKASKGDERAIEFSLWDFAGQEVYYATHQFFLNERSIYIVCCNMLNTDEYSLSRIEYWLLSLSARASNAPVIIVCSHYGESRESDKDNFKGFKDLLEKRFKARFRTLIEIYPVSNDSFKGVEEIVAGLVKIALSNRYKKKLGIEEERPVSWLELEQKAKGLRTTLAVPVYSWAEWKQLAMKGCGIQTEDGVLLATEFLHDLGSVIYFNTPESKLNDTVILDPEWLTSVFASVVSAKHDPKYGASGAVRNGILKHSDLDFIWKMPYYPSNLHPFLLAVLEKFEVLHRLEGKAINNTEVSSSLLFAENTIRTLFNKSQAIVNAGVSLIPSLLSEERPSDDEIRQVWPEAASRGQSQIGRYYHFEFLPTGFFSRLMVRILHSDWSAKIYWRYGVVLYKQESMLKLELDVVSHYVTLLIRGSAGANKMGSLIESIDTLISDWLNVDVRVTLPCVGCFANGADKPYLFKLEESEQAAARGDREILCRGACGEKIRLDLLVPDLMMTDSIGLGGQRVKYSDISVGPEIGRGGFAVVYKGHYQGKMVAVKQLVQESQREQSEDAPDERVKFTDYFAEFRREVWLMSGMHHRNIVQLIGVCTQPLCMVLEFCGDGDLYTWIHKNGAPQTINDLKLREKLALDISQGVEFLHSTTPPIIHRDLKSPNILLATDPISRQLECKIADFGLSRGLVWSQQLEGKVVANPIWLAPEILKHQKYTEKVDVYAFGVILWELVSAQDFFGEISFMSTIEDKIKRGERPPIPELAPDYIRMLIETCWHDEPSARPSFRQLCTQIKARDARAMEPEEPRFVNETYFQDEEEEREKRARERRELEAIRAQHRVRLKVPPASTQQAENRSDVAMETISEVEHPNPAAASTKNDSDSAPSLVTNSAQVCPAQGIPHSSSDQILPSELDTHVSATETESASTEISSSAFISAEK